MQEVDRKPPLRFLHSPPPCGLATQEQLPRSGSFDAERQRVHIRDAKGNKDRFLLLQNLHIHYIPVANRLVPLPAATLSLLRRFWQVHRNPVLLFPNRHGGLKGAHRATTPLDRGGVQTTLRQVAQDYGLKKRLPRTAYVTATPRI